MGQLDPAGKALLVNLTREKIEGSPSTYEHEPVTRQQEEEYYRHYGYPYYAQSWPLWGLTSYPVIAPPPPQTQNEKSELDSHLRSTRAMVGYQVEARDGAVGEVRDLLIDGATWRIGELVIKCGDWHAGKTITASTDKVSRISYEDGAIYLDATKSAVMEASGATSSFSAGS
ncbi:MAG: PRC-barrel domain-containing protein [Verrucomicrobiota bacterium]|nr:PRC-barrel domain-containing protein [Verrucomicrobiota bacterium]